MDPRNQQAARQTLVPFLKHKDLQSMLVHKFRRFNQLVMNLQERVRQHHRTKNAKIEILQFGWELILGKLMQDCSVKRDTAGISFCHKMYKIRKDIQKEILKKYITKCYELHAIAFLQWRKMYAKDNYYYDADVIDNLILYSMKKLIKGIQFTYIPSEETTRGAYVGPNFLMKYGLTTAIAKPYLINQLEDIGLNDPFPQDMAIS